MFDVADMGQGEGADQSWLFLLELFLREQLVDVCKGAESETCDSTCM